MELEEFNVELEEFNVELEEFNVELAEFNVELGSCPNGAQQVSPAATPWGTDNLPAQTAL